LVYTGAAYSSVSAVVPARDRASCVDCRADGAGAGFADADARPDSRAAGVAGELEEAWWPCVRTNTAAIAAAIIIKTPVRATVANVRFLAALGGVPGLEDIKGGSHL
jgi:hypothetical protein